MTEQIHDKGYKQLLSHKDNFIDLLKCHVSEPWTKEIDAAALKLGNTGFVTKDFLGREADILYGARIRDQDVKFCILLELQSSPDFTMPYRLLEYMTGVLSESFLNTKPDMRESESFRLPAVVPIVLYNGEYKWNCVRSFKEYFAEYERFAPHLIDFEYILIDVNRLDDKKLLSVSAVINYAMYLDKVIDLEELKHRLRTVADKSAGMTEDKREQLRLWIHNVVSKKMPDTHTKEIEKTFEKGGLTEMTYAIERVIERALAESELKGERKGKLKGELEGERKGKLETATAMMEYGDPIEKVSLITGIPEDELRRYARPKN
ncbi:MAG: Rpn family recombination-promoting nuclease/putative transposase [Clostridiales Family XIII bacterium]|jgi:predicted transposase/invertase (TIGR01784 family)|nr:Rpn family recombination-promoting nuclease/putative transposase [Clostridiales Family XIII bacterium]